jgi:hypothetical protein
MRSTPFRLFCFAFVVFLLGSASEIKAQDDVDHFDFATWWDFGVDFKIHKQFEIGLNEEIRLVNNSSKIDQIFTDVELKYSPLEFMDIATGFRFLQEKKKNDYDITFRFTTDVVFKHSLNRFDLSHRLRYTNKNEFGISTAEGDELRHQLRFRTGVGYNIKNFKVDPKLDVEFFMHLNKGVEDRANRVRIRLSSEYAFKKAGELGFFVAYERYFHTDELENVSILGLEYTLEVKRKKKEVEKIINSND